MNSQKIKKPRQKSKPKPKPNVDPQLSDDLDQIEQDSSYEKTNEIFALKSQINLLRTENQKLALDYEIKIKTLEAKNEKITAQSNQRKIQNSNLLLNVSRIEKENEELKNVIESHRHQIDGGNRKTADFHRSIEQSKQNGLGDPTDLINQLLAKDKQIQTLKAAITKLQSASNQPEPAPTSSSSKQEGNLLRQTIDELKKKEIAYKREYESMLQGKEEIIKKMATQTDEYSKKLIETKDKTIGDLKKEIDEAGKKKEELSKEIKQLGDKILILEQTIAKNKKQYSKKEQQLRYSLQIQKQTLTKSLLQKTKKSLLQKQQKHYHTQTALTTCQSQLLIHKQQLSKLKTQVSSLSQYNSYLETTNRQLEEAKKKLQLELYSKEEEIIEIRDRCFMEVGEVKRSMMEERHGIEGRLYKVEEELVGKKYMLEKYEKILQEKDNKMREGNVRQEHALLDEIQALRESKSTLQQELLSLKQENKQKAEAYIEMEKSIQEDCQARIRALQAQKQSLMAKTISERQQLITQTAQTKQTLQQKYSKLQMICQLLQLQKQQKATQYKQLLQQKQSLQKSLKAQQSKISQQQAKLKQAQQDYKGLQIMHEQLNEKYKSGVRDLEREMEIMGQCIEQERKKAEKRKNQGTEATATIKAELERSADRVRELEKELSAIKEKVQAKESENEQLKDRIEKLVADMSGLSRQKQTLQKSHSRTLNQTYNTYQQQKSSLLQYISQMQQNIQILTTKLSKAHIKQQSLVQSLNSCSRQLHSAKQDHTSSLAEIKHLLGKCKQLEEVSREAIQNMEGMRGKYEDCWGRYGELLAEKERMAEELDNVYDQVMKLNGLLMSKEEQLAKMRVIQVEAQNNLSRIMMGNTNANVSSNSNSNGGIPVAVNSHVQYQYAHECPPQVVSVPIARSYLTAQSVPTQDRKMSGEFLMPINVQQRGRYVRYDRIG